MKYKTVNTDSSFELQEKMNFILHHELDLPVNILAGSELMGLKSKLFWELKLELFWGLDTVLSNEIKII